MFRKMLLLACVVSLLGMAFVGAVQAYPERWPDPRDLLQVRSVGELAGLFVQLETALVEAEVAGDRSYAATVYRATEVAENQLPRLLPGISLPDELDKLREIREQALRLGAPLIAEEMFAEIYEQLQFTICHLADAATGRSSSISKSNLLMIVWRDLLNIETLVGRIEKLFPYMPVGDALNAQTYAYFQRKAWAIRRTVDELRVLAGAIFSR